MTIPSPTSFAFSTRSKSDQNEIRGNSIKPHPVCVIHTSHPLAFSSIKDAICSDAELQISMASYYSKESKTLPVSKGEIMILDTCSVQNWAEFLKKWHSNAGTAIALVSAENDNKDLELQMLHLGSSGIVTFADLYNWLPQAIHAVAEGHLWFKRDVLDAYIKQTNGALRRCFSADHKLTLRESQILDRLLQDVRNRVIAQKLGVSERTIKFHVSNIFRKLNIGSRKELQEMYFSSPSCTPSPSVPREKEILLLPKGA
jgi:DNA-binding NarL/FixJ family response regulator